MLFILPVVTQTHHSIFPITAKQASVQKVGKAKKPICVCVGPSHTMCMKKLPTNQTKPPAWLNTGSGKRVFCTVEKFLVKESESESERNTQL